MRAAFVVLAGAVDAFFFTFTMALSSRRRCSTVRGRTKAVPRECEVQIMAKAATATMASEKVRVNMGVAGVGVLGSCEAIYFLPSCERCDDV